MGARIDIARGQIKFVREGLVFRRVWATGEAGGFRVLGKAYKAPFRRAMYSVLIDNIQGKQGKESVLTVKGKLPQVLIDLPGDDFAEVAARVIMELADQIWDKVQPGDIMHVRKVKETLRYVSIESRDDELNA